MPQSITKETQFWLTYGIDALIQVEIREPSFWQLHYDVTDNVENLMVELGLVEETQDQAKIIVEACMQRMVKRFNTKLKPREFLEGDLVWKTQGEARKDSREGKLVANWAGPFRIQQNLRNDAYKLEEFSGKMIQCI